MATNECGCSLNEFELFDSIDKQIILEKGSWVDVFPLNNLNPTSPIEFSINGSSDEFLDFDNSMLKLRLKIVNSDGDANLTDADLVSPINNWIHSAFSDVILTINGVQVEGGNMTYPYKAYLTNLLTHGKIAKETHMQASGWYKDSAGKFDSARDNKGYTARNKLIKTSTSVQLCGPLLLDFFSQSKCCLPNTDISIKLVPSKPEFQLMLLSTANTAAKALTVVYEEAVLRIRRIKAVPSFLSAVENNLNMENALYPIQHTEVTTYTIPQGNKSHNKEVLFRGRMPKLVIVGFVANSAYNGTYKENPFNFTHANVTQLAMYREGESVPARPLTPSFEAGKELCTLEYMHLMQAIGIFNKNADIDLSMDEYKAGYTLFGFNLTPDLCVTGHAQPVRDGNLRLEVGFGVPLPATLNVIIYGIFDGRIEITKMRNVITDYHQ